MKHFEDLWEAAELAAKKLNDESVQEDILLELHQLILSYKNFHESFSSQQIDIPKDYVQSSKERIFGNILFNLAHLSLVEGINVFSALKNAIQNSKISILSKLPLPPADSE
jgi:hypothetical protein